MPIGKLPDEQVRIALNVARTLSELEKISPGIIEQATHLAKYECRYTGIIEVLFNPEYSDERIARIYSLAQQSISRMRGKVGARRSMRELDLDYAMMIITSQSEEDALRILKIKPDILKILKNKHLLGTDTDYNIGKQLKVGHTNVYFWRMRFGIPAKTRKSR